jgi:hypothetical protein
MNTTYAPFICDEAGVPVTEKTYQKPVSTFLKPAITSWISAPYQQVSIDFKPVPAVCPATSVPVQPAQAVVEVKAPAIFEIAAVPADTTLENFNVNLLSPELKELAEESNIAHVQRVIQFLQKGGESIKTFGKIFLNDLALQKAVLGSMMEGTSNATLNQLDNLQREFALRLAACVQAREVAQLMLAGC